MRCFVAILFCLCLFSVAECKLPADLNSDGKVDFADFLAFSTDFGKQASDGPDLEGAYTLTGARSAYAPLLGMDGMLVFHGHLFAVILNVGQYSSLTYGGYCITGNSILVYFPDRTFWTLPYELGKDGMTLWFSFDPANPPITTTWKRLKAENPLQ